MKKTVVINVVGLSKRIIGEHTPFIQSFLEKYNIILLNIFEEQVFDDTTYTICSFQFLKQPLFAFLSILPCLFFN